MHPAMEPTDHPSTLHCASVFKPDPKLRMRPERFRTRPATIVTRAVIVAVLLAAFGCAVTGCGQRGPLYYPDKDNPDRRR